MSRLPAGLLIVLGLSCGLAACRQPPRPGDRPVHRDAAAEPTRTEREPGRSGASARAFRIESPAELLRGTYATGRIGDVRLDNGRAAFVVQSVGGEPFGFALGGGNLIDAAALPDGRDELAQVFLYLAEEFPRQAVYSELAIGAGEPGEAVVLARGTDSRDARLDIRTIYSLASGSQALRMTTVLHNRAAEPLANFALGDALLWGGADPAANGQPRCPESPGRLARLAAVGRTSSYAYLGADVAGFRCTDGAGWTDTVLGSFALAPEPGTGSGPGTTVVRWLAVGGQPDTAGVTGAVRAARGDPTGRVAILTVGVEGEPVSEATVRFAGGGGGPPESVRTDAAGRAVVFLPPGRYRLAAEAPGRAGAGMLEVDVPAATPVELPLTAPGRLELDVSVATAEGAAAERAPVRVTVRGMAPTPDPSFGGSSTAGGFGNSFVLAEGQATRPVPPGTYEVLISRGPEYDLVQQTVDIPPGGTGRVRGTLLRRTDTLGWLAADLHVHTAASADSGTPPRDRVLGCAAEGVELIVSADHNAVVDFTPHVEALGLSDWVTGVPGIELTTDLSRQPVGHLNVFPLAVDPAAVGSGSPLPWLDLDYAALVAGARRLPGALVQINHPRSPWNGTFALLGVGVADDVPPASLAMDFDLLEVANGLGFDKSAAAIADWARLARCGRPVVPTGGSDAHALTDGACGYPRTWFFAGRDGPQGLSPEAFAAALRSGRVVVSTGPFVVLRVDDVPSGGTVTPKARGVLVQVRVEAAPWIDVRHIRVLVNGVEALSLPPTARGPEVLRLETQAPLAVPGDAAIWAEVDGESRYPFLDAAAPIRPWALTGPVWVDADGDGTVRPGGAGCGR